MKTTIIQCNKCKSANVEFTREMYDKKYHTHVDYATLDYNVTDLVSYKEKYVCECRSCGAKWEEPV